MKHCLCGQVPRRQFLRSLMVGAIASPLLLLDTQPVQASEPQATALVLSCIDFRFLEWERGFLAKQQLDHHYDWTALAGASLALSGYPHGAEAEAFWDQLDLSRQLHHIKTVIILDHQDCGAYASKIDRHLSQDPKRERQIHRDYLSRAYWAIGDRYLELTVELYFITLSGEVQRVNPVMPQSARV